MMMMIVVVLTHRFHAVRVDERRGAGRKDECLEADRAHGSESIEMRQVELEVVFVGRLLEAGRRAPHERGAAQVDECAVAQHIVASIRVVLLLLLGGSLVVVVHVVDNGRVAWLVQTEDGAAHAHLEPLVLDATACCLRLAVCCGCCCCCGESVARMHDEHAVGGHAVLVAQLVLPLGRLFLEPDKTKQTKSWQ